MMLVSAAGAGLRGRAAIALLLRAHCASAPVMKMFSVDFCGGCGLAGQGGDCATVTGCSCHEKVAQYFQLISAADVSLRGRAARARLLIFSVDSAAGAGLRGRAVRKEARLRLQRGLDDSAGCVAAPHDYNILYNDNIYYKMIIL